MYVLYNQNLVARQIISFNFKYCLDKPFKKYIFTQTIMYQKFVILIHLLL